MQVRQLTSVEQLRGIAPAWDRLWERSEVTLPTVRAELAAQWIEQFVPRANLRLLVVEDGPELVAALSLAGKRLGGLVPAGDLTSNYWLPCGELLLDPAADAGEVLGLLANEARNVPWPILWLDLVPVESPRWLALRHAFESTDAWCDGHERYRIGLIEVRGDYETYQSQRPRSLRRSLRKDLQRLEENGSAELKVFAELDPEEVEPRLREAFEIEDRSWKGTPGGTVLRTPGMLEFYVRQARQLAAWRMLRVAFLEQAGRPIAFEVGWVAKRVYHSFKVGFDDAYREFGPGHLLRMFLVRHWFKRAEVDRIDFQGPMSEALASWSTATYPIGRMVVAPGNLSGRALLTAYRAAAPVVRWWRGVE